MAITVNLRYEYYLPFEEEKADSDDTSETNPLNRLLGKSGSN